MLLECGEGEQVGTSAWFAAPVELAGGIALVVGLAVPVSGLLLALDMLGAFLIVHVGNGIFVNANGFELVLALGATALLLAAVGAGRFSLDRLIAPRLSGGADVGRPSLLRSERERPAGWVTVARLLCSYHDTARRRGRQDQGYERQPQSTCFTAAARISAGVAVAGPDRTRRPGRPPHPPRAAHPR
ncbi:hypothetical protein DLE60_28050 [Micromonospora globispora]|uniref:DoxX family protein n=1 Tax=Micromonospora globispora TaxID=1450148 RepID=UPI000D6FA78F|nr:hypothetical protein DLE60_28050 [Micromonospora globispora]RQW91853.1 hypothetical protein DKL51_20420 [Micromonospora globispora]